ncbi:MAG: DUF58 domain-containing protein [bacterium]|nr:DUF58 domain-containing protein [bacterium]
MWINKLIYLALLLYAGILALLYTNVQSLYAFIILLCFGGLQAVMVQYLKRRVSVNLSVQSPSVNKNEPIKVSISINNQAVMPVSCAKIIVSYENCYEHLKQYQTFNISSNSRSTNTINFTLASVHSGTIRVGIKKVMVYDFLRLFHRNYKNPDHVTIKVFPEVCMMESEVSPVNNDLLDSEVFSKTKSGDDPSEVFDIREYKEGDKIHRIHWKLSSKRDVFMVKEYSLPVACSVGILVSLAAPETMEDKLAYYDALLSTAASISYQLTSYEQNHYIAWYDEKKQNYVNIPINDLDQLYSAMNELLEAEVKKGPNTVLQIHHEIETANHVGKLYYIGAALSDAETKQMETLYENIQMEVVNVIPNNSTIADRAETAMENFSYQLVQVANYKESIEALQL